MSKKKTSVRESSEVVTYWLDEIRQAKKREEQYRKTGEEVLKIYEAADEHEAPFNILFSNTETLKPALYSLPPRPVVSRRFKDADPIGKAVSDAGRRMLEFLLDTNRDGYETVHEAMGAVVMDALLPGRGAAIVKYDATFRPFVEPRPPDEADEGEMEASEYAESEMVCTESVVWDRLHIGYAKKWHNVPWIAYEFSLTKEEVASVVGKEMAEKLTYHVAQGDDADSRESSARSREVVAGARKTACIYQIWDKAGGRKVLHVSPHYTDDILKEEADPLGLTGFFNMPRPLCFIEKASSLVPTAPYRMYQTQAKELNRITKRITRLIEAVKARGIYDTSLGDPIAKIMEHDDNTLIPAEAASSLASEKGFTNAIWFMPIDVIVAVLIQLYQAREACKQVIYEITGISDILRGTTQASETATAQTIKNQWGTLRLKRAQAEVARYVRDILRLMLELAATKLSEETWAQATQLPFLTTAKRNDMQMMAMAMQQSGQPLPPEMQQAMQQISWAQVLDVLKSDMARTYRIDIETNSTVEPDATDDLKAMNETMTTIGQFLNGAAPLVSSGSMPFEVVKSMLLVITRRSRFGHEIEELLQQMQAPKPPDDGNKAKQDQQQIVMQQKQAMSEIQLKQQQAEMSIQEQTMQAQMQTKQKEVDLQMREMALQLKEAQFEIQQSAERQAFEYEKQRASEQIGTQQKLSQMECEQHRGEMQVHEQAESTLGQGVGAMQAMVESLVHAVGQQAAQNQQTVESLVATLSRPRVKKAIRDRTGRIESVEESVA